MNKKAVVVLAEGFEEIEAATPIDVLRRAGVAVTVASLDNAVVTGAHGLAFQADASLEGLTEDFDAIVFPGGMPGAKHLGASAAARSRAESMLASGKLIAAICAAPVMTLGAWGMLDGRRATCYPGMETQFPAGVTFVAERVVVDGPITTSRGPGTALEFSLALAGQLTPVGTAEKLAAAMVVR